jgi:hypothetical protein
MSTASEARPPSWLDLPETSGHKVGAVRIARELAA